MFYECLSLKEVNLNNFIIYNESYFNIIFSGCSKELINKMKMQIIQSPIPNPQNRLII